MENSPQSHIFFIELRKRLKVIAVVMIKTGESSGENSQNIHHGGTRRGTDFKYGMDSNLYKKILDRINRIFRIFS